MSDLPAITSNVGIVGASPGRSTNAIDVVVVFDWRRVIASTDLAEIGQVAFHAVQRSRSAGDWRVATRAASRRQDVGEDGVTVSGAGRTSSPTLPGRSARGS